jgi:hypothetical protein
MIWIKLSRRTGSACELRVIKGRLNIMAYTILGSDYFESP